ncbi:hypothetical protein Tco_1225127 [Tanacetum coccineum]
MNGQLYASAIASISWRSTNQSTIAKSTTKVKYIAASDATKEVVWLKNFLTDLGVIPSISDPVEIFCDNICGVAQRKQPREHHKTKHILRKFHIIQEIVERRDVIIRQIPMEDNAVDPLTKPLPQVKHYKHAEFIGMNTIIAGASWEWRVGSHLSSPENGNKIGIDSRVLKSGTKYWVTRRETNSWTISKGSLVEISSPLEILD